MADSPPPLAYQSSQPSTGGQPSLARTMGLAALVVYGVGDMVGAGVYGTIGKVAGTMGNAVWAAFLVSMVAALLTGLSYASISSRYPRAAGAAYVTRRAYRVNFLAYLVGLATAASGLTSMATQSNVFAENVGKFLPLPAWAIVAVFLGVLTAINLWGIRESMWMNLLCTAVEVGGLLFVIAIGMRFWGTVDYTVTPPPAGAAPGTTSGGLGPQLLFSGAVLTFFAFIGFEDMLNVAEEVKDPKRTMPRGLVMALLITTVLYVAVAITAVSVVPFGELSDPDRGAPFAQITTRAAPWLSPWVFTAITLFAVANTALINYIMGSRLLYGMAKHGLVPRPLSRVNAARRTPHVSILTMFLLVLVLAFAGDVKQLASATSLLLLGVFAVVNVALIVLKSRPGEPRGTFEVPSVVPAAGAVVCVVLIVFRVLFPADKNEGRAPMISAVLTAGIAALYFVMRPAHVADEGEEEPGVEPEAGYERQAP